MILLTIITPVFQGKAYLKSCLDNVTVQWIKGIEHLVIDGGSEDGSVEILQQYSLRHPHLRWISEKDKGQSDAMNKGIRMAKGGWISFLNVDDFYEPGKLPEILRLIQMNAKAEKVLVGDLNIWNSEGKLEKINRPHSMEVCHLIADLCEWPFNPSSYFYPVTVHHRLGYFPEKEHFAMDYDFILKVAVAGIPFEYHSGVWGNFRLLPEAKTSRDQVGNQSYIRSQILRDKYFHMLRFSQKMKVRFLKMQWYFTLKWRSVFPNNI